jgi:hypothetical protein
MVAANDISAFPIYRILIVKIKKYARNGSTANYNEPSEPVDVFISALPA